MFHFTALWYINVLEKHFQRSRHLYSRQELGDLTATDRAEDRFLSECSRDCIPVPSLLSIIVISSKKKFLFDLSDTYFHQSATWSCAFSRAWNQAEFSWPSVGHYNILLCCVFPFL